MTVDEFLEEQRKDIRILEDGIKELLLQSFFYGNRRTMLKNAAMHLDGLPTLLSDDQRTKLRGHLKEGLPYARNLFNSYMSDAKNVEDGMEKMEEEDSLLLAEYMRLVQQDRVYNSIAEQAYGQTALVPR